eukprot:1115116-Pleurochrysis_carterae.AAC.1
MSPPYQSLLQDPTVEPSIFEWRTAHGQPMQVRMSWARKVVAERAAKGLGKFPCTFLLVVDLKNLRAQKYGKTVRAASSDSSEETMNNGMYAGVGMFQGVLLLLGYNLQSCASTLSFFYTEGRANGLVL